MKTARVNTALVLLALCAMAAISAVTGRIPVNNGQGWDGSDYADMVVHGWTAGTANTALRPLVAMLNRPALRATGDVVSAFRLMNYAYLAAFALGLCLLMDHYGASGRVKAVAIANVFTSIAFSKFFAFYPVLIDLGALALVTLAVWLVLCGRRTAAGVVCLLAVLSREFGIAALAFGVHRDVRARRPWTATAMTYVPAAAAFVALRWFVAQRWSVREGGELLTLDRLLSNLALWTDPVFAALFIYFLVTVGGGVSMLVFARIGSALPGLRREPEWITFAAVILAAAVVGDADIWRYLAYLAPALVVVFAWCATASSSTRLSWIATAGLVSLVTLTTQRPMQAIDVPTYFRDWFPYYIQKGNVPFEPIVDLWPLWGWRLIAAALLFWLLTISPARGANAVRAASVQPAV